MEWDALFCLQGIIQLCPYCCKTKAILSSHPTPIFPPPSYPSLLQYEMQYFASPKLFNFSPFETPQRMPNPKPKKQLSKLNLTDEQQTHPECEDRLESIIKTLRANNQRLLQKIEECDRRREQEHKITNKKNSEKCLVELLGQPRVGQYESACTTRRPMSQFKTDRRMQRAEDELGRKQNLAHELPVKVYHQRSEECEDGEHDPPSDPTVKLIKINLKKLVPLSIEKLKERMRML